MNKEIICNLLNNNIVSLTLNENNNNSFKIYLDALKINNSLVVLYLQDISNKNINSLLKILKYNKSLQLIIISKCDYKMLISLLSYFKLNYFLNMNISINTIFNLSDIEEISKLLMYKKCYNKIELFCIISDENCVIKNNKVIDKLNKNLTNYSLNYISKYKMFLILSNIKPLIKALFQNELLYLHLNFLILYYNNELISILKNEIQRIYKLPNSVMNRIDINNKFKFYKPVPIEIKN